MGIVNVNVNNFLRESLKSKKSLTRDNYPEMALYVGVCIVDM